MAKVDASGTSLEYAGYIGGVHDDEVVGIAVDADGNAYLAGRTNSWDGFPVTVGPDLTYNGSDDGFLAKVDATGEFLHYAGYIGGSGADRPKDVAVDAAGNAYVTGQTFTDDGSFPVTVGPDITHNGSGDAFVTKVNAEGTALEFSGFIGGTATDAGLGIALDAESNVYVTGSTGSYEARGFPLTVGPDLTFNGGGDAFVAKVNATGTALEYAGYIGGAASDAGTSIAIDAAGNAYVTGNTSSDENSFPVNGGPYLTHSGGSDTFVAKVNAAGTRLNYAGYIGGDGEDLAHGIAVDPAGNVSVAGTTNSSETSFPVTVGPDLTYNGGYYDTFVAKVTEVLPEVRIFPLGGPLALTTSFDPTLLVDDPWASIDTWQVMVDDTVSQELSDCFVLGTLLSGGQSLRCPGLTGEWLGAGAHTLTFVLDFDDGSQVTEKVVWEVVENTEP